MEVTLEGRSTRSEAVWLSFDLDCPIMLTLASEYAYSIARACLECAEHRLHGLERLEYSERAAGGTRELKSWNVQRLKAHGFQRTTAVNETRAAVRKSGHRPRS